MADRPATDEGASELGGLARAVEFAMFAPFALGARAIEELPGVVDRTRDYLNRARLIGMIAVQQGTVEIRRRVDAPRPTRQAPADRPPARTAPTRRTATDTADAADTTDAVGDAPADAGPGDTGADEIGAVPGAPTRDPADRDRLSTGEAADRDAPSTGVPAVGDLALPDYDHLPAAHVVEKLATLSVTERDRVEAYERAHRHRRTVLGKIEQLREQDG